MEHRWGIRRTLDVGVKLYVGSKPPRLGRLLNASSSGAYVATSGPLPLMTRVHLALGWDGFQHADRHRIAAHVVRSDGRGIAIEWQEFAPLPVLALIDALETSPSQDPLDGIRAITEAREVVAYIPWRHSAVIRHGGEVRIGETCDDEQAGYAGELIEGTSPASLGELSRWIAEADRLLVF